MTRSSFYFTGLPSPHTWSNGEPLESGRTGDSQRERAAEVICNKYVWSCHHGAERQRDVSDTLWNPCHKDLRLFWEQMGLLPSIRYVFLIKWPVSVNTLLLMHLYNQFQKMHLTLCDTLPCSTESGFATCGVMETYAPSELPEIKRKCKMSDSPPPFSIFTSSTVCFFFLMMTFLSHWK